jgi:RNA polymerase sigma factor (sigma-70 family)
VPQAKSDARGRKFCAKLIRGGRGSVDTTMSLDISPAASAWHKRFPAVAMMRPPRRKPLGGMVDSQPETDMSELLAKVGRTRDVELFEQLFRHFAPRVKAYMARTGSPGAAEELMQETMVAVWNKSALYDPARGAASTWIFTIARNLRIDAFRREHHPEFDENDPAFQPETEPRADVTLAASESASAVRIALQSLPADQAEVLRLAYFEDNSQSEIAAALSVPLGTVKSRMRLAFVKLRTALAGEAE